MNINRDSLENPSIVPAPPLVSISHLDQLWFQVAGTLCNLTCHHCFIRCSPTNNRFGNLTLEEVKLHLVESVALGVKEYYFTGGEPFLNRELVPMLIETLRYGPATVLTNGTVLKAEWLHELREADRRSDFSLEFRVSIDGFSAETNDAIRGEGTFARAMQGVARLLEHEFLPIITIARTWPDDQEVTYVARFARVLRDYGYTRPRLKVLPTLHLGAEADRTHGYHNSERVTSDMLAGYDMSQLLCEHSRMVTDRGVYVCPILIETPSARLADNLRDSFVSFPLSAGACFTCYQHGAICSNASGRPSAPGDV
jgi:sulfatase maturation enzyme AslB (radical SAM superfamily)